MLFILSDSIVYLLFVVKHEVEDDDHDGHDDKVGEEVGGALDVGVILP